MNDKMHETKGRATVSDMNAASASDERALPSRAARDKAINLLVSAARELEHAENHGRYGDGRDIAVAQILRERMAELRAFIPTREDDDK